MLTADLVHARRRKGELKLVPLTDDLRARALDLAGQLHDLAWANVGQSREDLLEVWSAVQVHARERKLADGLRKLIEDGLDFEVSVDVDPVVVRREVFELATVRRKMATETSPFDRRSVLTEVAARHDLAADSVEHALYADLKSAHVLREVRCPPPSALVEGYDLEQARAILLRAVRVTSRIRGASPGALRTLFRKLKFQRLLHSIAREPDGSFRIDIDGPFSLFESVTKYGLQLAIALPSITACGTWEIEADVRWGKRRDPLVFRLSGDAHSLGRNEPDQVSARLPEEVEVLLSRFSTRQGRWQAALADEVVDLPGVGLCVPDLAFTHAETGEVVLLEVMGFWSRDAVWKRVELVEAGLDRKILFAVSERLRVSEAVLGEERPAALYVYKGAMSAAQIERKLDALVAR